MPLECSFISKRAGRVPGVGFGRQSREKPGRVCSFRSHFGYEEHPGQKWQQNWMAGAAASRLPLSSSEEEPIKWNSDQ